MPFEEPSRDLRPPCRRHASDEVGSSAAGPKPGRDSFTPELGRSGVRAVQTFFEEEPLRVELPEAKGNDTAWFGIQPIVRSSRPEARLIGQNTQVGSAKNTLAARSETYTSNPASS